MQAVVTKIGSITEYDDYLRIPSASTRYAVVWRPKEGVGVFLLRDFALPERRVVEIRPESHLGMIQVNGSGAARRIYVVRAGKRGAVVKRIQEVPKYGHMMVVPAGPHAIRIQTARRYSVSGTAEPMG